MIHDEVTEEHIAEVVAKVTGIPVARLISWPSVTADENGGAYP